MMGWWESAAKPNLLFLVLSMKVVLLSISHTESPEDLTKASIADQ